MASSGPRPSVLASQVTSGVDDSQFRVIGTEIVAYRDASLTQVDPDAIQIEQGTVLSGKWINDNVIYISDPYNIYLSSRDLLPIENITELDGSNYDTAATTEAINAEPDDPNQYVQYQYAQHPHQQHQHHQQQQTNDPYYDPNDPYDPRYEDASYYEDPNDPNNAYYDDNGNIIEYNGARPPQMHETHQMHETQQASQMSQMVHQKHATHGTHGTHPTHPSQSMQSAQSGLSLTHSQGHSQGSQGYSQGHSQSQGMGMAPLGHILDATEELGQGPLAWKRPNKDKNEREDSVGSHRSNRSNRSNRSHGSHRSHRSDRSDRSHRSKRSNESEGSYANSQHSELSQNDGSPLGSERSFSMSEFHGVGRERFEQNEYKLHKKKQSKQMKYVKDPISTNYHAISKKDLKSPLIFNQITNDIRAKRVKTGQNGRVKERVIDNILLSKFTDAVPVIGRNYFTQARGKKDGIVIGIHLNNEKAEELEATLCSIYDMVEFLRENNGDWVNRPVNILIIQDGWKKAHKSMQRYIQKLFPKMYYFTQTDNFDDDVSRAGSEDSKYAASEVMALPSESKYWWEYHTEIDTYKENEGPITFIFEKTFDNPTFFQLKFPKKENGKSDKKIESQAKLHLTLIIKLDNRQKHNSQHWFFGKGGFADAYHSKYLFTTQAYTLFDPACLYWLVAHLDARGDCSAATGRQRAMSRGQQGKKRTEFRLTFDYALRQAQMFDYEFNNVIYMPVFGASGFLPGIPGPCGLYRCSDLLTDEPRDWYLNMLNKDSTEIGFFEANLRVAEDRILSYASVLKVSEHRRMAYVPEALFFFQTMTNIEAFADSRRRWINGTYCGFLYLLVTNPSLLSGWHASTTSKTRVWGLLILNALVLLTQFVTPAISFSIMHGCLLYVVGKVSKQSVTLSDSVLLFVWVLWILHMVIHNTQKYNVMIMSLLYTVSMTITVITIVTFAVFVFSTDDMYEYAYWHSGLSPSSIDFAIYCIIGATLLPFACAYLVGGVPSVLILGKSVVLYIFLFHLLVPFFTTYAFARSWDVTIDDTPMHHVKLSDDEKKEREEDLELVKARFLQMSRGVLCVLVVLNLAIYALPVAVKVVVLALFLFCIVAFILLSLTVCLLKQFCGDLYVSFCEEPAGYHASQRAQQMQMYNQNSNQMGQQGHTQGQGTQGSGAAADDEDDGVIIIPEEYDIQPMPVNDDMMQPQDRYGYGGSQMYDQGQYGYDQGPMQGQMGQMGQMQQMQQMGYRGQNEYGGYDDMNMNMNMNGNMPMQHQMGMHVQQHTQSGFDDRESVTADYRVAAAMGGGGSQYRQPMNMIPQNQGY